MHRRLTTQDTTWFLDLNSARRLNLDPSYQRKSVWTRSDRQYFLDTIFNNYPSPAIFLHKELDDFGNATYHVIDGKQRLETILLFVDNKLPIRDDIGNVDLANKKWRDLAGTPELMRRLWDYQFTVEMIDNIEPAIVNDVFSRLNKNSRKLMPQEIRHSRFDGWFVSFAENESDRAIWKQLRVSTTARARRMQDVQFISELMALTERDEVSGFDQDDLDNLYAKYDDPTSEDFTLDIDAFAEKFSEILSYVEEMEKNSEIVSKFASSTAHIYSLWSWIVATETLPAPEESADAYREFMSAVSSWQKDEPLTEDAKKIQEHVKQYVENSRGASTDQKQRAERQKALSAALMDLIAQ
ncbi:hypothetical protein C6401_09270 [Arthrobacter woluwensis]|uniref:DUF262 domain-containing protein n=1 Tax=Arthrobacter woluwensis TaxID=156980 RepID=UPI000D13CCDE|nr:DUF262 domain-containing protein [Arthrobacter woluwensis]PSS43932.1 hypothetical protein C6401_09270 [Arthrobacter woluwensis]